MAGQTADVATGRLAQRVGAAGGAHGDIGTEGRGDGLKIGLDVGRGIVFPLSGGGGGGGSDRAPARARTTLGLIVGVGVADLIALTA